MKGIACIVLVVLCLLAGTAIQANLIVNGSFETSSTVDPGATLYVLYDGATDIDGWVVTAQSIDYIGGLWPASDGLRSLDLCGFWDGGIYQSFTTQPGVPYQVTFDLNGNAGEGMNTKYLRLSAAGQSTIFSYDLNSETGWKLRQWVFTAAESTTTLWFESWNNLCASGPALDNVHVAGIPEPGVLAFLAAGGITLAACRSLRRRRPGTMA